MTPIIQDEIYYDTLLDRLFTEFEVDLFTGRRVGDEEGDCERYIMFGEIESREIQAFSGVYRPERLRELLNLRFRMDAFVRLGHVLQFPIWSEHDDKIYFAEDVDALVESMQWRVESSPFKLLKPQHLHEKLRLVELVAWGHVADVATLAEWVQEAGFPTGQPDAAALMHHGQLLHRLGEAIQEREDEHAN
jgi:hypothetical protein